MLKDLFEYEVLIDAEGRCENYTIHGYVAADHWHQAEGYIYKLFTDQGDKVIKVTVKSMHSLVDIVA